MAYQLDKKDPQKMWQISQRLFINFPLYFGKSCTICGKVSWKERDRNYMEFSKTCAQCDGRGYYHYDIDQHPSKRLCTIAHEAKWGTLHLTEYQLVELLLYWENLLIGFSYDCLEQCPCCQKYIIDNVTKESVRNRQACNLCQRNRFLQRITSSGTL